MTALERAREAVASDPRNAPFEQWCISVLDGEHDDHPEVLSEVNRLNAGHPSMTKRPTTPDGGV